MPHIKCFLKNGIDPDVILNDPTWNERNADVAHFVTKITQNIMAISSSLPQSRFEKSLKPYWDQNLKVLSTEKKKAWKDWVDAGKPRDRSEVAVRY